MSALLRTTKPYYLMSASDPGRQEGVRRHRGAPGLLSVADEVIE